ncbi:hypothetical protein LCGC14_2667100, partial [marine sediment metagenome]
KEIKQKEIEYVGGTVNYIQALKEHVTSYIYFTPERYKIKKIMIDEVPAEMSINTQENLDKVRKLYVEGKIK